MKVIVPLAGPDFVSDAGVVKGLVPFEGKPLLQQTLSRRSWFGQGKDCDMTFVLQDRPETRAFAEHHIADWFPGCSVVFLSHLTKGAALSALSGVAAALSDPDEPVLVDLADICYSVTIDIPRLFAQDAQLGGLALTFESDQPIYSYLRRDGRGNIVEAAEKRLISKEASAGTYGFRSAGVYLRAVANSLARGDTCNDLYYVCPLFNGVLAQGLEVKAYKVDDVQDVKVVGPEFS